MKQLRRWVTLSAACVALCAVVQMLVFGFVHYTEVRWEVLEAPPVEAPLSVVLSEERGAPGAGEPAAPIRGGRVPAAVNAAPGVPVEGAPSPNLNANPNRVLTGTDGVLRNFSAAAQGVGVIAGLSLITLTMLGVLIAAGAAVPGVEKAVTSAVWASILGLLCVPWRDVFPSMIFPGVFTGYDRLVAASGGWETHTRSGASALAQHLLLPIVVVVAAAMVMLWFRAGVERGTIITAVSELDEALEREMNDIRRRGVAASAPRSVGALNRALGDAGERPLGSSPPNQSLGPIPAVPSSAVEPPHLRAAAGAESMAGLSPSLSRKSGRRTPREADDDRRPI